MSRNLCSLYIVDDEEPVLESMAFLLESYGYEVETFSSGIDFLNEVNLSNSLKIITGKQLHTPSDPATARTALAHFCHFPYRPSRPFPVLFRRRKHSLVHSSPCLFPPQNTHRIQSPAPESLLGFQGFS